MKNRVAELRSSKNLSQEELAQAVGISRQSVIAIEKGRFNPSLPLGLRLGKFFEVSVEDIFELDD
ncbi:MULTISPECIES: helix-turn-helix transcriptional regulator [Arthrobacter]|jgi:putative transcriptional regulator|uniref:helix-turn-helix transcriptional regulator n=1 Tax=Arthrobacter TaxID=1663 RepID=UPI001F42B18F|nr:MULTISPECIES: helix-turn-helix transcriptional regulator [Arthrobacter]MDQ0031182.1 putative transcriptional regulator [Arthrobacter bambusae]MDQ0099317.1 putative transcriptional regulator [Arthrobacter bambusae]